MVISHKIAVFAVFQYSVAGNFPIHNSTEFLVCVFESCHGIKPVLAVRQRPACAGYNRSELDSKYTKVDKIQIFPSKGQKLSCRPT